MPADLAGSLNHGEAAVGRVVVTENVERVLAGMEPRRAGFHFAFVLVCLANLELEAATLQGLIEALVGRDDLGNGLRFGALLGGGHSVRPRLLHTRR